MNFEQVALILNQKTHYYFGDGFLNLKPSYRDMNIMSSSVTILPTEEDAFNLKPPVAGSHKSFINIIKNDSGALYRGVIGFTLARQMAEDNTTFLFEMAKLINEGLIDLTKNIGDLTDRKVHIKRPGQEKEYFRDLENMAAFEFRLYVEKLSV